MHPWKFFGNYLQLSPPNRRIQIKNRNALPRSPGCSGVGIFGLDWYFLQCRVNYRYRYSPGWAWWLKPKLRNNTGKTHMRSVWSARVFPSDNAETCANSDSIDTGIPLLPKLYLLHRLVRLPPTLECFTSALWTLFRSFFSVSIDIWKFQNNNGHG